MCSRLLGYALTSETATVPKFFQRQDGISATGAPPPIEGGATADRPNRAEVYEVYIVYGQPHVAAAMAQISGRERNGGQAVTWNEAPCRRGCGDTAKIASRKTMHHGEQCISVPHVFLDVHLIVGGRVDGAVAIDCDAD